MKIKTRQAKLIEIVRRMEKASVHELSTQLDASPETIRRDLSRLSEMGKILKVHGGARMPRVVGEGPFKQRLSENVDAKVQIASTATALVDPGETLFIDTGSTTLIFAEELAKVPDLTVITNATEIARAFASADNGCRVFLLGGEFGADNNQTFGELAASQIRAFRAHHAFLAVGAIDLRSGAMDFNTEEAQIAKAMIEQSQTITVLADSSKFRALASFSVCPLSAIDRMVTESPPPPEIATAFEAEGGRIILPT